MRPGQWLRGWLYTRTSPPVSPYLPSERLAQEFSLEALPNPVSKPIRSGPAGSPLGSETITAMASEGGRPAYPSTLGTRGWGLLMRVVSGSLGLPYQVLPSPKSARKTLTAQSLWEWLYQNILLPSG